MNLERQDKARLLAARQEQAGEIHQLAQTLQDNNLSGLRGKFEAEVNAWPEDKKQELLAQGIDPLSHRYRQHAEMRVRSGRAQQSYGFME